MLDIQDLSASIYTQLLIHGHLNGKELVDLLHVSAKDIEKSTKELQEKGYIQNKRFTPTTKLLPTAIEVVKERAARYQEGVLQFKRFIDSQVHSFRETGVIEHEGIDGIRTAYDEVLEEAKKTKEVILAIESSIDVSYLGSFIDNYISRRIECGVTAHVICPNTPSDKEYKRIYGGDHTKITLTDVLDIGVNINVVGEVIMTFSLSDPIRGIIIRDAALANLLKSMFYFLQKSI